MKPTIESGFVGEWAVIVGHSTNDGSQKGYHAKSRVAYVAETVIFACFRDKTSKVFVESFSTETSALGVNEVAEKFVHNN